MNNATVSFTLLLTLPTTLFAATERPDLQRFCGQQGCALGPTTQVLASEAELDDAQIDPLRRKAKMILKPFRGDALNA